MKDFWAGLAKGVFGRVSFGGVVGKICLMFAVVAIAAGFALRSVGTNDFAAGIVGVLVVCGLVAVLAILLFAHLHPDLAVLEGAHVLQYQKNMLESKNQGVIIEAVAVEAPAPVPVLEELQAREQVALPQVADSNAVSGGAE